MSLASLTTALAAKFDENKEASAVEQINGWFQKIDAMSKDKATFASRCRFMLQDLIELRANRSVGHFLLHVANSEHSGGCHATPRASRSRCRNRASKRLKTRPASLRCLKSATHRRVATAHRIAAAAGVVEVEAVRSIRRPLALSQLLRS